MTWLYNDIRSLDNTLISRVVSVGLSEFGTVFEINDPHLVWRLTIRETSGLGMARIIIDSATQGSTYEDRFDVAPNGAQYYQGVGNCRVRVFGADGPVTISASLENPISYQPQKSINEGLQTSIAGAWTALGTNGFPRPFTNYLGLWVSANFDMRILSIAGATIFQFNALNPADFIMQAIPVSQRQSIFVRAQGAAGNIDFRAVWYKER